MKKSNPPKKALSANYVDRRLVSVTTWQRATRTEPRPAVRRWLNFTSIAQFLGELKDLVGVAPWRSHFLYSPSVAPRPSWSLYFGCVTDQDYNERTITIAHVIIRKDDVAKVEAFLNGFPRSGITISTDLDSLQIGDGDGGEELPVPRVSEMQLASMVPRSGVM